MALVYDAFYLSRNIPQNIWRQAPGNQFVTGSVDVAVDDKVGFLGKVVLERYDSDRSIIFEMLAQ